MNLRLLAVATATLALGGTIAGCGDDEPDVSVPPTVTTPSATTPAGGTSPLAPESASTPQGAQAAPADQTSSKATSDVNLGAAIGARAELATLATAINAAGLRGTLDGKGPYTVFAPNNDGFTKLGTRLDTLLQTAGDGQLASILRYHVVEGDVKASDLTDGKLLKTLNGTRLRVQVEGRQITLTNSNGSASVIEQDLDAANGTIHLIDAVMQPKD